MTKRQQYLSDILAASAAEDPVSPKCSKCRNNAQFRCEDCAFNATYCSSCCKITHTVTPWHRIGRWQGRFFRRDIRWQQAVELDLYFGHSGTPCPVYTSGQYNPGEDDEGAWTSSDEEEGGEDNPSAGGGSPRLPSDDFRVTKTTDEWGNPLLTVVHTNGIHFIRAKFCRCSGRQSDDRQILAAGMYPASQNKVQTVFTQHVLNDCLLARLECKATTSNFYSKLRRQTSQAFPHVVPVRYISAGLLDVFITVHLSIYRIDIESCFDACDSGYGSRKESGVERHMMILVVNLFDLVGLCASVLHAHSQRSIFRRSGPVIRTSMYFCISSIHIQW